MNFASFVSLIIFTVAMSGTPGPNNLLLATSGLAYGFRRTIPALIGVQVGIGLLLLLCGAGVGTLVVGQPLLQTALKLAGAAYLIYLAWRLWGAGQPKDVDASSPLRVWHAAAFQFLNPKAWMMAVSAVSVYVVPAQNYLPTLFFVTATFIILATPCTVLWAAFGAGMKAALKHPRRIVLFNRLMAALTALSAGLILFWT